MCIERSVVGGVELKIGDRREGKKRTEEKEKKRNT
jgi:hypothetical protein